MQRQAKVAFVGILLLNLLGCLSKAAALHLNRAFAILAREAFALCANAANYRQRICDSANRIRNFVGFANRPCRSAKARQACPSKDTIALLAQHAPFLH